MAVTIEDLSKDRLIVSNSPELITSSGIVFDTLLHNESARLLYHHKNGAEKPLYVKIMIHNHSEEETSISIQKGMGGSTADVVYAGYKAAEKFMYDLFQGSQMLTLEGRDSEEVIFHKVKPGQTVSGLLRIDSTGDTDISVKMMVVEDGPSSYVDFVDVEESFLNFKPQFFDMSFKRINVKYKCDISLASFEIGGSPFLMSAQSDKPLKGNYGMMHYVSLEVHNPFKYARKVGFFLSPKKQGSVDRGIIWIDGEFHSVGVLNYVDNQIKMERFYQLSLEPNETKNLELLTFPIAGCFYPIDVVIKTDEVI